MRARSQDGWSRPAAGVDDTATVPAAAPASAKAYTLGTHRVRPPAETLRAIGPLLERFGITRVANVTGLDRIGIPVWQAIRPNGRALAVSQGKGLDPASARVSAIMESIEAWHAEFALPPVRMESHRALARSAAVVDPLALPRVEGGGYDPDRILPWVAGEDVLGGGPVWVPFELVHVMFVVPEPPGTGCFVRSSNGLASGNTRAEAAVHALCELVERDALARAEGLTAAAYERRRVDLASVDDPAAAGLLARLDKADIAVAVHELTTEVGLPTFTAVIADRSAEPLLNPAPAAFGAGCHLDPGVALCRALTEAAQSRLTVIAGARDDIYRRHYRELQSAAVLAANRRRIERAGPGRVAFARSRSVATDTVDGDLAAVLARLRAAGIACTALVDLGGDGLPFRVVRAIVPGLLADRAGPARGAGARVR
jgi:ribosomal protein S12 methylthiotransferase accessory factor